MGVHVLETLDERRAYFASWDRRILRDVQTLLLRFSHQTNEQLSATIGEYLHSLGVSLAVSAMPEDQRALLDARRCSYCEAGFIYASKMPNCEVERTGRLLYEECTSCGYWGELFKQAQLTYKYEFGELKEVR